MMKKPKKQPEIECPRCGEADERAWGVNRCGLCECQFLVHMKRGSLRVTPWHPSVRTESQIAALVGGEKFR